MMHFPCFRFPPYFRKMFRTTPRISRILPFFSHSLKISNFNPISRFQFISPLISRNFSFPLLLQNSHPPDFVTFTCFFTYFTCSSPYFYRDAFMHNTMHVLDSMYSINMIYCAELDTKLSVLPRSKIYSKPFCSKWNTIILKSIKIIQIWVVPANTVP